MTKTKFLEDLGNVLESSRQLAVDTDMKSLDEFDSLAVMSLVAYIHKTFGKQFNARQINGISTVQSLMDLIGKDAFND